MPRSRRPGRAAQAPPVREDYQQRLEGLPAYAPPGRTRDQQDRYLEAMANEMSGEEPTVDNPNIPAAYTYFGQFVDHDLTLRRARALSDPPDANKAATNARTPRFDLDSVYGRFPAPDTPWYEPDPATGRLCFRIGHAIRSYADDNLGEPDLPRFGRVLAAVARKPGHSGRYRTLNLPDHPAVDVATDEVQILRGKPWARTHVLTKVRGEDGELHAQNLRSLRWMGYQALIADERNDENVLISQLHLAFLRLHNRAIREAHPDDGPAKAFYDACRLVRWHYQWVVLYDFLPRLLGPKGRASVEAELRRSLEKPTWTDGHSLPLEFTLAAYRAGHAMPRPDYLLNQVRTKAPIPLFKHGVRSPREDLAGGQSLPDGWTVQWDLFLDGPDAQQSRAFGPTLSEPMANHRAPYKGKPRKLPFITLARGLDRALPSGQAVARRLGHTPLRDGKKEDPLWIYVLKEAAMLGKGAHLGPVGASIVAGTLIEVMRRDPGSFLSCKSKEQPEWQPTWGDPSHFDLKALLLRAGMPFTCKETETCIQTGRARGGSSSRPA